MTWRIGQERTLRFLDFDFESKPWWFWYDKPTAVITALSYMWVDGDQPNHDTLTTTIATLDTPESYKEWLTYIRSVLTSADVLTGHNIDRFDLPLLQGQLLRFGLPALPALLTQDTMRIVKRRDTSASQESLLNYRGLKPVCPIGMPVYKDHLSIPQWEEAALGWNNADLAERPSSDVHGHVHLREVLIEKGYLAPPKAWKPSR